MMRLTLPELLKLQRWNTPTIYNGWEQITQADVTSVGINLEETKDFMPQMGPMVGYAVTLVVEPSSPLHASKATAWRDYRQYVADVSGPKIVVVQDLDRPKVIGSFWGEVNASVHRALGCVGTITDGAIRDLDEMTCAGFKAIARRLCVGHAHVIPVRWGVPVEVFGQTIRPGQLVHADKHGFLAIPEADEAKLLESSLFMDNNECNTVIAAAKGAAGCSNEEILKRINQAAQDFGSAVRGKGEWK